MKSYLKSASVLDLINDIGGVALLFGMLFALPYIIGYAAHHFG